MKQFGIFVVCALLFQLKESHGAPRRKRWIPDRYSDNEYGTDSGFVQSGPAYEQQNYMSYYMPEYNSNPRRENSYGDYSGMFRAGGSNDNSGHVMVDPVQQLQNVHAFSYAQTYPYTQPNRQLIPYNQYVRAPAAEVEGRGGGLLSELLGSGSSQSASNNELNSQGSQTRLVIVKEQQHPIFVQSNLPQTFQSFGTQDQTFIFPQDHTRIFQASQPETFISSSFMPSNIELNQFAPQDDNSNEALVQFILNNDKKQHQQSAFDDQLLTLSTLNAQPVSSFSGSPFNTFSFGSHSSSNAKLENELLQAELIKLLQQQNQQNVLVDDGKRISFSNKNDLKKAALEALILEAESPQLQPAVIQEGHGVKHGEKIIVVHGDNLNVEESPLTREGPDMIFLELARTRL